MSNQASPQHSPHTSEIATALRGVLPLHAARQAEDLATLLGAALDKDRTPAAVQAQLSHNTDLMRLIKDIAGQHVQTERAMISFGSKNNIGDITIRDVVGGNVINLSVRPPDRTGAFLTAIVSVVGIVVIAIIALTSRSAPSASAPEATPDSNLLNPVGSQSLAITALAADNDTLWVGAEDQGRYALYRTALNTSSLDLEQQLVVDDRINGIHVDCKGNLWVMINNQGTLVYRPATGEHSTMLNRATTNDWLPRNTTHAVASSCADDGVTRVWLGRIGIRKLSYTGDYPTFATIVKALEPEVAASNLDEIKAMVYITMTQTLWAMDGQDSLLSIPDRPVFPPAHLTWPDASFTSLAVGLDGTLWAGGVSQLIRVTSNQPESAPLSRSDGVVPDVGFSALAAGEHWLWIGDSCDELRPACWPLSVYVQGVLSQVLIGGRKDVRALAIDRRGSVWIGTERGLLVYPAQD